PLVVSVIVESVTVRDYNSVCPPYWYEYEFYPGGYHEPAYLSCLDIGLYFFMLSIDPIVCMLPSCAATRPSLPSLTVDEDYDDFMVSFDQPLPLFDLAGYLVVKGYAC